MKKCPYCAEEIKDEAIKCKHCNEWLMKENDNDLIVDNVELEQNQNAIEIQNQPITKNRNDGVPEPNPLQEVSSPPLIGNPKKNFPKYGSAWFLLYGPFAISHSKSLETFYNPLYNIIELFLIFPILIFYFWYRRLLIKKQKDYPLKKWKPPLYSLLLSYCLISVSLAPMYVMDGYNKRADIKAYLNSEYFKEIRDLKKKQDVLMANFNSWPIKSSEVKYKLQKLDEFIEINNLKMQKFHKLLTDLKNIYSRKKDDNEKLSIIINNEKLFINCEELWNQGVTPLKESYLTNDVNKYELAANKFQDADKCFKEFQKNIALIDK